MTAADPHEGLASPLLGAQIGHLAGEPLPDLGGLYRDGSGGGLTPLAGLPISWQYATIAALPTSMVSFPGNFTIPAAGFVPLHGLHGDGEQQQDLLTIDGQPHSHCPASDLQPACFSLQYQQLLNMQAEQAQHEASLAAAVQGQVSGDAAAPAAGTSDQSTAWAGLLLPGELLTCWPQAGLVKQEAQESVHASRSSSAQQQHLGPPAGQRARAGWAQEAADEGDMPAVAAVVEEGTAERAALACAPPGRRRTRSMSQQEAAAAAAMAAATVASGSPGDVLRQALQEEEGKVGERGSDDVDEDEEEGGRRKRQRQRQKESPPASPSSGRPRRSRASGARALKDDSRQAARTSKFRGVTRHRRSGRYEAHIWVKSLGRQLYLGGYEQEEHAAEAYDIAALKSKGRAARINFGLDKYTDLLGCIDRMTVEELVMAVRRQSQGFSRGSSAYRGVTHHPSGRYEARVGIPGSRHAYLGLFNEEAEAARAYDRALVRLRGRSASTNFPLGDYKAELADHFAWQSRMLLGHARFLEIQGRVDLFEQWLKGGLQAFPELAAAADSTEAVGQGEQQQAAQQELPQAP